MDNRDPFLTLPTELTDAVLELLDAVDVASLRLAGCIQYLPLSHWRDVFRKEMPWLWEIYDDVEPSFWATTSLGAIQAEKLQRDEVGKKLFKRQLFHQTVIDKEFPGIWEEYVKDKPWLVQDPTEVYDEPYAIPELSRYKAPKIPEEKEINWCKAFREISLHGLEIKGLRNRKRIWEDVEEILRRIERFRKEGHMEG